MQRLRGFFVSTSMVALCMLLGAALYESVVMAPNYMNLTSLEHARGFLVASTPGTFFRALSPVVQILLLMSVVLTWRASPKQLRWLLLSAFVAAIATDVVTFAFHYPRNHILFVAPLDRPASELHRIALEWAWGNYVRIGLLAGATMATMIALRALPQGVSRGNWLERSRDR